MKRIIVMFLAMSLIFTGVALAEEEPSEIELVLHEMDELVSEEMFEWLISLYDKERGGFYHAISSRDNTEFLPDIESTSFALDMLVETGLLPEDETGKIVDGYLSSDIMSGITETVQSMQDEDDGFFYHSHWQKNISESRKNRDLNWSIKTLRRMGVEPLYLLPSERITDDDPDEEDIPAYLRSEEALLNWMNNAWNTGTPYSVGNLFSSALGEINAAGLRDIAVAFITEKQNEETGLWGEGLNYINSNAAMKLVGFYSFENPLPHIDKLIASIATIIIEGEEEPGAVVDVWNPIEAIIRALGSYETIPPELRETIDQAVLQLAEISIENIKPFKRDDGGYSYGRTNSSSTSQGAYVGYGLEEGDINAARIATVRLRSSLYQMAGLERAPLFDTDFANELMQQWENLPPVQKIEKPIGLDEDFEDIELGRLPVLYTGTVSGGNRIEVVADPLDPNNQALLIERNALNTNSRLNIPVNSGEDEGKPKITTISMDIMIESPVVGTLFYNRVGTDGVQWVISGHANGFTLSNRSSESGIGTRFGGMLTYGEWHNLKIEYIPDGKQFTVINYYIDDEFMFSTNEYFNRGNAEIEPASSIESLRFDNFNAAGILSMYVDNLQMTVEETDRIRPIGLNEGFEEIDLGSLPSYFNTTLSGGNRIEAAIDPTNPNNQALLIERNRLNTNSRLQIPIKSNENPYKTIASMDIMIESPIVGTLFYNSIGANAIQWVISGHSDGFTLSSRSSERGIGTPFADRLAYGEWHNLKIEYIPDGKENTMIHYYIDDELLLSTNEYFNDGDAEIEPDSFIHYLRFDNFNAAGILKLYVDNLRMTMESVSTSSMMERMDSYVESGVFANDQAVRALNIHLTALQIFEQQGNNEKVVQHMEGFHVLLDHQRDQELVSEQAYSTLKADVDALIDMWE